MERKGTFEIRKSRKKRLMKEEEEKKKGGSFIFRKLTVNSKKKNFSFFAFFFPDVISSAMEAREGDRMGGKLLTKRTFKGFRHFIHCDGRPEG